jgi:outer membrane protein TolC
MILDAELAVEHAKTRQRLERSDYWPDIILGIDYRIRKDVAGDPVDGADYVSFKLGLDIPLWFFTKQKHRVLSAEHVSTASREKERSVREMLVTRLEDAQSMLALSNESIQRYDTSIMPEAEAALHAAEVAYEVGQIDFNALLAAQSDLFDIRIERLDLLRKYNQTRAALAELHGSLNER